MPAAIPTSSAVLSDISAIRYDYFYRYKRMDCAGELPVFSNDLSFRAYVRYNTEDDLDLMQFEEIYERYTSDKFHYAVGRVNLRRLRHTPAALRARHFHSRISSGLTSRHIPSAVRHT